LGRLAHGIHAERVGINGQGGRFHVRQMAMPQDVLVGLQFLTIVVIVKMIYRLCVLEERWWKERETTTDGEKS
jgi:hypothetical protein